METASREILTFLQKTTTHTDRQANSGAGQFTLPKKTSTKKPFLGTVPLDDDLSTKSTKGSRTAVATRPIPGICCIPQKPYAVVM